ncbi:histidine phosphatase family protein [Clostridium fungisolvens]|uniref:2,3-bisphosphoglycerate-dependent phosphoglycerate mutase n=1 Tax=Clostridium fungisolvens TaxID=1604897 RepID=A0A6V8SGX8_9CLOT|nr:histidine phosphatase family protein [Clostridium fungisolvens]GFP76459.1 2,3-bisphosphoglycerate-dependent phosphoglycerate mutase [Clostridium fungisolvens]
MAKTLYLMRHGQTLFNLRRKIQGWSDSPLTEKGIEQAKTAGKYFKANNIIFDHAYCSTSERCVDTLEIVTENNILYTRVKGLKEMYYGTFEGESEDLNPKTPKECETFYLPYGGESSNTVRDRMIKTLTEIMEKEDHYSVLAVSHSGACFNFLRALQDPMEELEKGFTNCCIFVYEYENNQFKLREVIRHCES